MFGMPKPLSQRLYDQHLQANVPFSGRVTPVESANPAAPEIFERVQPTVQERLLNLVIVDPELAERRREIIGPLSSLTMEAERLIAEAKESRNELLESELEAIREAGRNQEEVVESLKVDHQHAVLAFKNLREQSESLAERIKDLKSQRLSRWASKEQRETHQKKIDALQKQLRSLNTEVAAAGQDQLRAFQAVEEGQDSMRKISDAEIRCRGQLSGNKFIDPEYGLPISPTS
jgi:chromosome segregation ATPase